MLGNNYSKKVKKKERNQILKKYVLIKTLLFNRNFNLQKKMLKQQSHPFRNFRFHNLRSLKMNF